MKVIAVTSIFAHTEGRAEFVSWFILLVRSGEAWSGTVTGAHADSLKRTYYANYQVHGCFSRNSKYLFTCFNGQKHFIFFILSVLKHLYSPYV